MNTIFFWSNEVPNLKSDGTQAEVSLTEVRARSVIDQHQLKAGIELACVVNGVGIGRFIVDRLDCSGSTPLLGRVYIQTAAIERTPIKLVVAFSRPQTVKKLLQLSAAFGLVSISFVYTEKVQKSYIKSKIFLPAEIEENFLLGCQQAGDSEIPLLKKYYSIESFLDQQDRNEVLLLGELGLKSVFSASDYETKSKTLFLGPEAGLTSAEKQQLFEFGFQPISLGVRMLRTEVAAAALIGSIL